MPLTPLSESQTTAVLHLDNSDGYTKFFQDDIKIPSKANQLITFPSNLYHAGTTCTDQDKRQVLNLNFFGTLNQIKKNYKKIQKEMMKNKLPTNKEFIEDFVKAINDYK